LSVEIREEPLEFLTYVWGPPDPYPAFEPKVNWPIYPYPLLDDIREDARPVRYRALVVENEHLRVTVLPELGGHLHSAVAKVSGEDVFYHNHVVKPGLLGLRGAWLSGGIEWNFPCGHTVTTVSPVDARLVREDDGSATIWVGNIEQVSRMAWAVGIRLRPDAAAIETEIRLANRTALPHPYYFWANAAVPARDDMRMVYPGTKARSWMGHFDWPMHQGKDLARYTAFDHSNDVFLLDSLEDFFGVYYEQRDFGVVHVADVHQSFGKKFFTWGTAEHGRIWSAALSDNDGPYCEIQSGRFVDQSTWQLMPPHHTESWLEWWYPVAGMGGFDWANRDAAVGLTHHEASANCSVLATRPLSGVLVRLSDGARVIHEQHASLKPGRPLRFKAKATPAAAITLSVLDWDGSEIIRYTEKQQPRTITLREAPAPDESRPGGLLVKALRAEERADPEAAWKLYEKALILDLSCEQAALALGRIATERSPEQAIARLESVAAALPESAAAAYYLGIALTRAGRDAEAETELWRAAHWPEFAHAAAVELGLIAMRRGEWQRAAELLVGSLGLDVRDAKARAMLMAALRNAGEPEAALELVDAPLADPSERAVLSEVCFSLRVLGRQHLAARRLRELSKMMLSEPDPWIELALDYLAAGMPVEASDLLAWSVKHVPAVAASPLIHYLLAHALALAGRTTKAAKVRSQAGAFPADLTFTHHWEFEPVLRAALVENPADVRARYRLGNLLYSQGRRDEALAEWERAAAGEWDHPVLRRNLALAYREVRGDLARAESELRRAVELSPADVRLYLELNEVLSQRGAPAETRLAALNAAPDSVQRRGAIAAQQVVCCIELERWDRALDILSTHTFHRWELEFRMRGIYLDACLGRGIARLDAGDLPGARTDFERALEYPMNLRIGKPSRPSDARAHWCAGVACEALGETAAARAHWEAAAAEDYHKPDAELTVYRALSLRKLGRTDEAGAVLAESVKAARERADHAPEDASAHFVFGLALKAIGEEAGARAALERALVLNPAWSRARRLLEVSAIL
jgi:tetratricopeptide (TPR) repeat protein